MITSAATGYNDYLRGFVENAVPKRPEPSTELLPGAEFDTGAHPSSVAANDDDDDHHRWTTMANRSPVCRACGSFSRKVMQVAGYAKWPTSETRHHDRKTRISGRQSGESGPVPVRDDNTHRSAKTVCKRASMNKNSSEISRFSSKEQQHCCNEAIVILEHSPANATAHNTSHCPTNSCFDQPEWHGKILARIEILAQRR
nr:hypothetical protein CFP56_72798 [Quercus suber]